LVNGYPEEMWVAVPVLLLQDRSTKRPCEHA
jgi:hypothetical protein